MTKQLFFSTKTKITIWFFLVMVSIGYSQTNNYTGTTGGVWSLDTNWSLGHAPLLAEDVTIPNNINITIDVATANCNSLTILTGINNNAISLNANTLNITGALTIEAPTANNIVKQFVITTGTLNCGSIVMNDTTATSRDCRITVTSGIINCTGNINMNGADTENQIQLNGTATVGATLNLGGNFIAGAGGSGDISSTNNNSIVNYNGSVAQTVAMNGFFVYNNLVLNNSNPSGATLQAAITTGRVNRNITIQSGIFNNGGFSIAGNTTRVFTVANGATFILSGTTSAFPSGFTTRTLGATSNVIYNGSGNQTIFDIPAPGYGNLELTNAIKTPAGNLDIQGNLTINPSTTIANTTRTHIILGNILNDGIVTFTSGRITLTGSWTNNGTITGGTTSILTINGNLINNGTITAGTGASNINIFGNYTNNGTFTSGTGGLVTFTSTTSGKTLSGNLTGATGMFNRLTFNGVGGSWTLGANLQANGNLGITNGTLNNGGFAIIGAATRTFTVSAGGRLELDGTTSAFPSGFTTNTVNVASTVEYKGSGSQTIFDVAAPGYGNLILSNNSTKTFANSVIDIQGTVTINPTATLVATAFSHNVRGSWINNGTFTAGTSTINFTSTVTGRSLSGTLSGATGAFNNLTFNSTTGGWTLGSNLSVNGNLNIARGIVNNGGFSITGAPTKVFTIGASGRLELDGTTSSFPTGFTTNTLSATSTVEYKGSGNQNIFNVAGVGYGNLIVNNATKTAQGNLSLRGNLTVQTGTLDNGGFSIVGAATRILTVSNGATLRLSGTVSAFPSAFTTNTLGVSSTVEYAGTGIQTIFDVATPGYGNLTISGNATKNVAGDLDIQGDLNVQTGTLNNAGFNITGTSAKSLILADGTSLLLSGTSSAFPSAFGTNTLGVTSTVNYAGTGAQSIFDIASPGYGNLTISGNATKTSIGDLDIQGDLNVQVGVLDNGGFNITGTGSKSFILADGASLLLSGTSSTFPNSFGTNTLGVTSTVNYSGSAAQTVFDVATPGYGNLTISGNATKTTAGDLDIQGDLNVQVGVLDNGGFNIAGNGSKTFNLANGAALLVSGTNSSFPSVFGSNTLGASSTVNYSGTAAQTIFDIATPGYGNLIISGNDTKTLAGDLDIQGDLNVQAGVLNNGGFNIVGLPTKSFTVADSATLQLEGSSIFPSGFSTTTLSTLSTVEYKGTGNQTFYDVPSPGYGNLTFNGVGGIWVASTDIDVANLVHVVNGNVTFNNVLTIAGNGPLTVNPTGLLTLNNGASLIQSGYTGANSGNIMAMKNTSPIRSFDYTYWCAPTSGTQTLLNFSPSTLTDKFLTYHNAWSFVNPTTTTFSPGIGYGIRAPQGLPTTPANVLHQFTGVPNNGDIDVSVTLGTGPISNRLIGNPYPSTLDADAFINANIIGTGTINQTISGTLYFWTHNNTLVANNYSSNDYATYNLLGGTAVSSGTGNTTAPTRYIASGQGFFVQTVATGNVSYRNDMRLGANNINFYRTKNGTTASRTSFESHRIWLNLTNSSASFSQILLGYTENATFGIDPGYDGLYYGAEKQALFSIIDTKNFTIQSRPLPFSDSDIIPIGYRNNIAGNVTLSIDHVDGLFLEGQKVYLQDNLTNTIVCLSDAPYTFNSATGEFKTRFNLIFRNSQLRKDVVSNSDNLKSYFFEGQLHIVNETLKIKNVYLFDLLGRLIEQKENVNSFDIIFANTKFKDQVLILRTEFEDGSKSDKKIKF